MGGQVIVVASGKGGTGKTSLCAGISEALSVMDKKVLLIDADAGMRNLDLVLGMTERTVFTFADVVLKNTELIKAAVCHPVISNMALLTAPAEEKTEGVGFEGIKELLDEARLKYDFIIVDCSAGVGGYLTMFIKAADTGIVAATPDNPSLRAAERITSMFIEAKVPEVRLVLNRVRPRLVKKKNLLNIDDAIDKAGARLLGIVPEDEDVITAGNAGVALALLPNMSEAMKAYINISKRLIGKEVSLLNIK